MDLEPRRGAVDPAADLARSLEHADRVSAGRDLGGVPDAAQELRRDAHKALADFDARAARLGDLADFIVTRQF